MKDEHQARPAAGLPVVAILGRPNVGKSTFFNRMIGRRRSLALNRPGVTRDRIYGETDYEGRRFILIDTGGFEPDAEEWDIYRQVKHQAMIAAREADVILLFLDGRSGVGAGDLELVDMLRRQEKPVLYVVNKIDTANQDADVGVFYELGVEVLYPISSEHSRGVDALLDALLPLLPPEPPIEASGDGESESGRGHAASEVASHPAVKWKSEGVPDAETVMDGDEAWNADGDEAWDGDGEDAFDETAPGGPWSGAEARVGVDAERPIRIALIGRPNVGKSSLANRLLGEERQVIHPEAGTTRDPVNCPFTSGGVFYELVDTAGIRRQARISDPLEKFTVTKAFQAIDACDMALLLIDAREGVTSQEKRLAGMIAEKGRAVALLVNKWDLIRGEKRDRRRFADEVIHDLEHIRYAPVHFISALTGWGIGGILPVVNRVQEEYAKRVPTAAFNRFLTEATTRTRPPTYRGSAVKMLYGLQVRVRPPTFRIFVNYPEGIGVAYRRYLENRIRERFGFVGVPINVLFKARKSSGK